MCSSVMAFSLLGLSTFLLISLLRVVSTSALSIVHGALFNFLKTMSFWFMLSFFASILVAHAELVFPFFLIAFLYFD